MSWPGIPCPVPPRPTLPAPLHLPSQAGGARLGSGGQKRRRLVQISDLA